MAIKRITTSLISRNSISAIGGGIKRQIFNATSTWTPPSGTNSIQYFIVAGGGSGGARAGGGGGAGGF